MLRATASLFAACAVGMGAFGAHGLKQHFLDKPAAGGWWETATLYLLVHAIAVAALASTSRAAGYCMLIGAFIFSGTLYAMALGAPTWLGAITPLGGTALILGWLVLTWDSFRKKTEGKAGQ